MSALRASLVVGLCLCVAAPGLTHLVDEKPVARAKPGAPAAPAVAPIKPTTDRERAAMDKFADCIAADTPRRAAEYRDMKLDDSRSAMMLRDIASNECLQYGELAKSTDMLRGALFRSFYQRERRSNPVTLGETAVNFATYVRDPKAPESARYLALMDFAGCVVRAGPTNAHAFTLAAPGSDAEKEALTALQPNLGPCLPSGMKVALTKSIISAVLAEALYRETQAGHGAIAGVAQ